MNRKPCRVAIVEDHADELEHWLEVIDGSAEFEVIGTAASASEARLTLPTLNPEIILLDINLPDGSGVDLITELRQSLPEAKFLMLTVEGGSETLFACIRNGAMGYLLKEKNDDVVLEALRNVREGYADMSPIIARQVLDHFRDPGELATKVYELTAKQVDVLEEAITGSSIVEIAENLAITEHAAKNRFRAIFEKMHVRNRAAAVYKYLRPVY